MIGRPEWFKRRKYGGWGITPKTWQGWVYIAVTLGVLAVFQSMPFWGTGERLYFTGGWLLFLLLDVSHIMVSLERDERERRIEALSERNASWFMATAMVLGVVYQVFRSAMANEIMVDPFLAFALMGGMAVKSISNYVLGRSEV